MAYTRYFGLSALAATAVVYHAFFLSRNPVFVNIQTRGSRGRQSVVCHSAAAASRCHQGVLTPLRHDVNCLTLNAIGQMMCLLADQIFLGSLRDIEQEMIKEKLSSAVMESLLALTVFREEFGAFFVAMFSSLVFVKVLHWLVQNRVDYIEVTPTVSRLQHIRIISFMSVLLMIDAMFLSYTVQATIAKGGHSVMLLFAFEYIIQASDVVRYFLKYAMSMVDLWLDGRWESKGTYVFYLELVTDLLHLFVYIIFFGMVFTNYGMPLHLVRDLYSAFRNFRNRIIDFLRFRQVSARLNRLPDASQADLERSDGVCIICREEMARGGANKKLMCGHVFHLHCLRSWLERQQNCPTCRGAVFQRRQPPATAAAPPAPPLEVAAAPAPEAQAQAAVVPPEGTSQVSCKLCSVSCQHHCLCGTCWLSRLAALPTCASTPPRTHYCWLRRRGLNLGSAVQAGEEVKQAGRCYNGAAACISLQ
ncbi:RING-type domain-containing protein [Haematococcus lacustris]|uniref:RING-type E3 ubiquitin transferase n=1 Tax=Haematococcus lacustris TaxID=44745 RepID=A0A699ZC93_HAELA|nr:RING-type domain-containing protein [Haematococcus lacustris]